MVITTMLDTRIDSHDLLAVGFNLCYSSSHPRTSCPCHAINATAKPLPACGVWKCISVCAYAALGNASGDAGFP